jgi:hypothetical protein
LSVKRLNLLWWRRSSRLTAPPRVRSAPRRLLLACGVLGGLLWGCGTSTPSAPALRPEEEALVDLYVQITRIEAMRAEEPDSVGPALDRLSHQYDSLAVRQALDGLRAEPERWEYVYGEIARRLQSIEESPNPTARRPDAPVPRIKAP